MAEIPTPNSISVSVNIPYVGGVQATWEPDESEQKAAWEMYVELVTRISVVELQPDEGLLREALTSLYSIFQSTREIMRRHGPSVARPKGPDQMSFGYLAVLVLNRALRPVLAKWHPLLLAHEETKPDSVSSVEHERNWDKNDELRQVLNQTRDILIKYADTLAEAAGVHSLVRAEEGKPPLIVRRKTTE